MPQPDPTYAPTPAPTSASWSRRILALLVDWVTCLAVVEGLVAVGVLAANPNGLGTLGLFVVESALFTAVAGGSFGKLATRVRVVRQDGSGQPPSLLRALLRSALVGLLVPPLLTMGGRGLHDVAAGTRTVTL
ncbi:RDD family protein [Nocardioides glacieisoli]|uniref:RDD family protein n=1 Tax=Nocardioides glacieisoli TaxID=1168730 RepID=A0A4Q2RPD6_9ACTN|nr:RDD family protein [Nocardioides glacieisoli]RYB89053.1 RDD family protein [Nocardioides glacieisoli]